MLNEAFWELIKGRSECVFIPPEHLQPALVPLEPCPKISKIVHSRTGRVGQAFSIEIATANKGSLADSGGITVSFPQIPKNGEFATVVVEPKPLSSRLHVCSIGDAITSADVWPHKITLAQYLLCERWREPWRSKEPHVMTLRVTPHHPGSLKFYITTWAMKDEEKSLAVRDPAVSPVTDQQGHRVYPFEVNILPANAKE